MTYNKIPAAGEKIEMHDRQLKIPDNPIIPFIEGDGIGPDITAAMKYVVDAAVEKAYGGKKHIAWMEIYAGEKANELYGTYMPDETISAIRDYVVSIKGPLTTPIGGGIRSLNVHMRQALDLYACVRPVSWIKGVPSPVKAPEKVDMVIYRENTEDVYAGIEWESGSKESNEIVDYLNNNYGVSIRKPSGIGIKPISSFGSKRLAAAAIRYARDHQRDSVTLVHKGNIMKFTEGAFKKWGYEEAAENFSDITISEELLWEKYDGKLPDGKILVKDRIADAMFQQALLRPDEYSVLALPNLNGDYISDALAAQVGGLGMAPGANIGDDAALFEATHGTAPKYTGMDKVNPGSLILSAVMMLEHIGWDEAGALIKKGMEGAVADKQVTYDLARQMGCGTIKCSQFGKAIAEHF